MLVVSKSRFALPLLLTALALIAGRAIAQEGSEYTGATVMLTPSKMGEIWPDVGSLSVRTSAPDSTNKRAYIRFFTAGLWSDSGVVARWGDTLIAATSGQFGDTTFWLGTWDGKGYSGRYLVTRGPDEGRYGKWAANLLSGDPLPAGAPQSLEFRKWLTLEFGAHRRADESAARAHAGMSPTNALGVAIMVLFCTGIFVAAALDVKSIVVEKLAQYRARPPRPNPPGGYAVPCPYCGTERMQEARALLVVSGMLLLTRAERCVIAGCTRCVRRVALQTLGRSALLGPRSIGGLVATPYVLLYNAVFVFTKSERSLVESLIRKAGLDPERVRVDDLGFTMDEYEQIDALTNACRILIWARGQYSAKAFDLSAQYLLGLYGDRLTRTQFKTVLTQQRVGPPPPPLSAELRPQILKLLRTLATVDGEPSRGVIAALMLAGKDIGCSEREMNEVVRQLMNQAREAAAARAREEAAAQAREREQARARADEKARESRQRSGSNGNGHHSRPPRRGRNDLDRARSVLGVTASAAYDEIVRAYRSNIAIWHPDRAGLDAAKALEFTHKAKELTWAMEALRRAMQAQAS